MFWQISTKFRPKCYLILTTQIETNNNLDGVIYTIYIPTPTHRTIIFFWITNSFQTFIELFTILLIYTSISILKIIQDLHTTLPIQYSLYLSFHNIITICIREFPYIVWHLFYVIFFNNFVKLLSETPNFVIHYL